MIPFSLVMNKMAREMLLWLNPVQLDAIDKPDNDGFDNWSADPDQCDNINNSDNDDPGNSSVDSDQDDTTKKDVDETDDETSGGITNQPGTDGTTDGKNDQEEQAPPEDKIESGLLPGSEDDVGELKVVDDRTTFSMGQGSSTKWFTALVAIDGKLLPGFAPDTVKQLRMGKRQDLRVEVKLAMGEYTDPCIMLRFKTRHRNIFENFTHVNIPLGTLLDAPEIENMELVFLKDWASF